MSCLVLTIAETQAHLAKLTYKPGWSFSAYEGLFEGHHIVIRTNVEDSYHPGEKVTLDIRSPLPPFQDILDLEHWLIWRLSIIETHEAREWLQKDGKPIFDPHADFAERDER